MAFLRRDGPPGRQEQPYAASCMANGAAQAARGVSTVALRLEHGEMPSRKLPLPLGRSALAGLPNLLVCLKLLALCFLGCLANRPQHALLGLKATPQAVGNTQTDGADVVSAWSFVA